MSPSRRSSQGGQGSRGGRGGRGRNDDDDDRGGRGGRRRSSGGGSFGSIFLVFLVLFFVISAVGLWVYYHNLSTQISDDTTMKDAYATWLKSCQDGLQAKAGMLADELKPIYQDQPQVIDSAETIQKLTEKYGPTLQSTQANYVWCRKNWFYDGKGYSANVSPKFAQQFSYTPPRCLPLDDGKTINLMNLNGSPLQTGTISCFYDLEAQEAVAVVQFNLAAAPGDLPDPSPAPTPALPPPAENTPATGGDGPTLPPAPPPPSAPPHTKRAGPSTMFVLWFDMPMPDRGNNARKYLNKMIKSAD